jgi:cysteine synthase A
MFNQSLRFADVPIVCELSATEQLARLVLQRVGTLNGILTFNDSALVDTARLAQRLGLPFLAPEVAARAVNKAEQRRIFGEAGLMVPRWRKVSKPEEAAQAVELWGPTIVKPTDRAAGAGVTLVRTPEETTAALLAAQEESWAGEVLVEEYVKGPEVSVESVAVGGRQRVVCMADKTITQGPHFVELGHVVPSHLPPDDWEAVSCVATAACQALGLDWGACHTEVKLTNRGPMVVEVNPRLAGDCIPDLIEGALGIDLYEVLGRQALGEPVSLEDVRPRWQQGVAIGFWLSPGGVLNKASSDLLRDPPEWLLEFSVTAELGKELPSPTSNAGRIGYVMTTGKTGQHAAERVATALSSLTLDCSGDAG